jgi:hypothetical protein
MSIHLTIFIKHIINSKDISAKFGADVILDFIDFTYSNKSYRNTYYYLDKALAESGKFSEAFIQTVRDEYSRLLQEKKAKQEANKVEKYLETGKENFIMFYISKIANIPPSEYLNPIKIYHYGEYIFTIDIVEYMTKSIDSFEENEFFDDEMIDHIHSEWNSLSDEEKEKWVPQKKVNHYKKWISIYYPIVRMYYLLFLKIDLEGVELFKKMGKIWTAIKESLNKDEFNEYTEEVPFIKISDSYKRHAHVKNERILIKYINESIVKEPMYHHLSLEDCKKLNLLSHTTS